MEEKKYIKISLSTALLIISIIIIAIMGVFIYNINNEKNNANNTISNLNNEITNLKEIVNNRQDEEKTTSTELNTTENTETSKNEINKINIEGEYLYTGEFEAVSYYFKNGEVTLETLSTKTGTYEIVGNTVKIKFTKIIEPGDDKSKTINEAQELIIQDENTLVDEKNNTKYVKEANTNEINKINIEGEYLYTGEFEAVSYYFKNGEVTLETLSTKTGTYEIVGNTVKIKFTKIIEPGDDKSKTINEAQELIIQDENTLVDEKNNTKYVK